MSHSISNRKKLTRIQDEIISKSKELGFDTIGFTKPELQKEVKKKLDRARTEVLMTNQRSSLLMARVDPAIQVVTISGIGAFLAGGYIFAGDSFKAALPSLLVFLVIFIHVLSSFSSLYHTPSLR